MEIERDGINIVFDTIAMPWIHRQLNSLCIWIESSFESRVLKAIISHNGGNNFSREEIEDKIIKKDKNIINHMRNRYSIDILMDRNPFDIIIDTSRCIDEANCLKSFVSIQRVHAVIRSVVGFYLTQSPLFAQEFNKACRQAESIKISINPEFQKVIELIANNRIKADAEKRGGATR